MVYSERQPRFRLFVRASGPLRLCFYSRKKFHNRGIKPRARQSGRLRRCVLNNSVFYTANTFGLSSAAGAECAPENSATPAETSVRDKADAEAVRARNHRDTGSTALEEHDKLARFEQSIMPHMNAAYNLARWLAGNDADAQDVVQEAYLRAYKFLGGYRGGDSRSWLLRIVRNAFYDWLKRNRRDCADTSFDEELHGTEDRGGMPDSLLLQKADQTMVREAIEALPREFREILVLRELEGCSYKEIADIAEVPLGTVMSRLARAREQLRTLVVQRLEPK
jgi:RNA polymerase sigma-70 factor, ECF subfamily